MAELISVCLLSFHDLYEKVKIIEILCSLFEASDNTALKMPPLKLPLLVEPEYQSVHILWQTVHRQNKTWIKNRANLEQFS